MMREFKVEANVGKPQVAYRETITKRSTSSSTRTRSRPVVRVSSPSSARRSSPTAGRRLRVRRQDHRWSHPAGVHPAGRRRASGGHEQRCARRLPDGRRQGHPVDGQYHDVDSSEMAFKIAGRMAFKEAAARRKPVLLEPIMAVEVVTPEDYLGDVIGDLNCRRGQVRAWSSAATTRSSTPRCRCRRCSDTYRPAFAHPGAGDVHDAVRLVPAGPEASQEEIVAARPRRVIVTQHRSTTNHHDTRRKQGETTWLRRSSSGTSRT